MLFLKKCFFSNILLKLIFFVYRDLKINKIHKNKNNLQILDNFGFAKTKPNWIFLWKYIEVYQQDNLYTESYIFENYRIISVFRYEVFVIAY